MRDNKECCPYCDADATHDNTCNTKSATKEPMDSLYFRVSNMAYQLQQYVLRCSV
ncbi:hypothetical protein BVSY1_02540 [Bacillus velezensis]|nr:hypothetical protein BVSY1_02540 [Bacillus velezensis]